MSVYAKPAALADLPGATGRLPYVVNQSGWALFGVDGRKLLGLTTVDGQLVLRDEGPGAVRASFSVRGKEDGQWLYAVAATPVHGEPSASGITPISGWTVKVVARRAAAASAGRDVMIPALDVLLAAHKGIEVVEL